MTNFRTDAKSILLLDLNGDVQEPTNQTMELLTGKRASRLGKKPNLGSIAASHHSQNSMPSKRPRLEEKNLQSELTPDDSSS